MELRNLQGFFLRALKKKEEDLQDAERTVFFEHCELHRTKEELEQREKEIAAASCRYEKIGEELKQANLRLASQARHIDDIKLRLRERDQEIVVKTGRTFFERRGIGQNEK
ncbi:hypothetical protein GBA52_001037 [Prunus armeniaca]|nr:hypothetical protein GBA52_001037 [Prunus armeniaca]